MEMFVKVFGGLSVLCAMIFQWYSQFVAGEETIGDAEQSGRLETAKMNENSARVAAVLKDDHRASCRLIKESTGGTKNIVHLILSDDLKKRKLCVRFAPYALTVEQREQRIVHAKDLTIHRTLLI